MNSGTLQRSIRDITEGTSGKVTIVYESEYEKHLRVKYSKGESKLSLGLNDIPNKFKRGSQPLIHVYLEMDRIDEVMTSGGGAGIFFDGDFTGEDVRLSASVASTISDLELHCRNLDLSCSGASRASVAGTVTDRMEIELSGASNADLKLSAQELECNISGASSFTNSGNLAGCEIEFLAVKHIFLSFFNKRIKLFDCQIFSIVSNNIAFVNRFFGNCEGILANSS